MTFKFYVTSEKLNKDIRERFKYIRLGMIFGKSSVVHADNGADFTKNILEGVERVAKNLYENAEGVHSLKIIPSATDGQNVFYQGVAYRVRTEEDKKVWGKEIANPSPFPPARG